MHRPIVDVSQMATSSTSLALPKNTEKLEDAISKGMTITLQRVKGTGRFVGEEDGTFQILPLQMGFYDLGWYLGYERLDNHLLRFERLDRLQIVPPGYTSRWEEQCIDKQKQSRQKLKALINASYGVYLGHDPEEQRKFLSQKKSERESVEVTMELWLTEYIFRFISEGTKRFPGRIQMSPRLPNSPTSSNEKKKIFTLKETGSPSFPHRFKAHLPIWVLRDDVLFRRWILGFAGEAQVVEPEFFAWKIAETGMSIYQNYLELY